MSLIAAYSSLVTVSDALVAVIRSASPVIIAALRHAFVHGVSAAGITVA